MSHSFIPQSSDKQKLFDSGEALYALHSLADSRRGGWHSRVVEPQRQKNAAPSHLLFLEIQKVHNAVLRALQNPSLLPGQVSFELKQNDETWVVCGGKKLDGKRILLLEKDGEFLPAGKKTIHEAMKYLQKILLDPPKPPISHQEPPKLPSPHPNPIPSSIPSTTATLPPPKKKEKEKTRESSLPPHLIPEVPGILDQARINILRHQLQNHPTDENLKKELNRYPEHLREEAEEFVKQIHKIKKRFVSK